MHEEINQKISRFIDGELDYDETLDLLKKIQSDESLKHKMSRFQAISQALKTDEFYQVISDFSHKVFQEIQQEPAYLLPQLKPQPHSQSQDRQPKPKPKPKLKVFAVAASILVVAVLVGQSLRNDRPANKYQTLTAMALPQQQLPASSAQSEKSPQHNRQPLNAQFNDYLQAHNNSVYTNGEANFQPYAKVTAYGQD
ncbi:RseA family anti-sigma factor [Methyloglobulus sp.]|uniref:RseA family anti-sigma factor n=1 Tax=Methyloglobulus sp. TaxID=2518622 RepID=UPI003989DBCC